MSSYRCALGCSSKSRSKSCHRFPNRNKYPSLHAAWIEVLPEKPINIDCNLRICHKHFLENDKYHKGLINRLAIPALCLPGRPDTHKNCNCDGEMLGLRKDTESKDKDKHSKNITKLKHMSLLEIEHDYVKPQEEARTLDYVHGSEIDASSSVPVNIECDELQSSEDPTKVDFKKLIENYTVKETIKETINDADLTRVIEDARATLSTCTVETKESIIPQHHNTYIEKTSRKTKIEYTSDTRKEDTQNREAGAGKKVYTRNYNNLPLRYETYAEKEAISSENFSEEKKSTSTIPNTCFTKTNSEKLCFKDADSRPSEISRSAITKADTKPTHKLTHINNSYKEPVAPVDSDKVESNNNMLLKSDCNDGNLLHKLVTEFYDSKSLNPTGNHNLQQLRKKVYDAYLLGSFIVINSEDFTKKRFAISNVSSKSLDEDVQLLVETDPLVVGPDIGIDCGGLIADITKSEDEMSCGEGSNNKETENDMSIFEENSHLDDNIHPNKRFDYDDIDIKVEIAYALKFMHNQGKSPDEATKEILDMYGPDKMTVMEVKCWYKEFDLGNKITNIIYSGGPVYKQKSK